MTAHALAAVAAASDPADATCAAALSTLGFREPVRAWKNLRRLAREVPPEGEAGFYDALAQALGAVAAPDRALNALERLLGDYADSQALAARLAADPAGFGRLVRMLSTSEFLGATLARSPALAAAVLLDPGWDTPLAPEAVHAAWRDQAPDPAATDAVHDALRLFKQRMLLRIGAQDVLGVASVDQTLAQVSAYADACMQAAYEAAYAVATASYGVPHDERTGEAVGFCVLALGKCGGAELNYSSDLDLIFVFGASGTTVPPGGATSVSNTEFFTKVGERFIKLLTAHERGGRVFRVDMRLRPMGSKGTLVGSYDALIEYYESWGRTWERQMLIKARPVAGDLALGRTLLHELRPFIYPKYLDIKAIREVHQLKRSIEVRTQIESDPEAEVKTGRGGIRDIEFAVQFLQLLNGGRRPEIRTGNTLAGIAALERLDMLTRTEASAMAAAYRFLRRVENRLQLCEDLQRHRLPADGDAQVMFAGDLGYEATGRETAWQAFQRAYKGHTAAAHRAFRAILGDTFEETPLAAPVCALLQTPDPDADAVTRALAPYALRDPAAAWVHLEHLANGPRSAPLTGAARDAFAALCPLMLQRVAASPDPDQTLTNVRACLDAFGTAGAFYDLLLANPKAVDVFVSLASFSEMLIRILLNDPGMLDFLIHDTQLEHKADPGNIKRALDRFLEINPDFHTAVRRFRNGELLRIGLRDMLDLAPIQEVTGELSAVADTVLDHLWAHEAAELTRQYGSPIDPATGDVCESAVLGLGKCGGRDLNYTSDLDIVFVYAAAGETAGGVRAPLSNHEYFQRLAQRVTRASVEAGPYGFLYKLDMRLRPYGGQGELALTVDQFLEYYRTKAAPWEHQALVRMRPMAGSLPVGARLTAAVHDIIYGVDWWNTRRVDHADTMLRKIQAHRAGGAAGLALKNEAGGILEVEFLVQLLRLRYGPEHPQVREPNTLEAIAALSDASALPADQAGQLADAYAFLRRTENRLRIMYGTEKAELPEDPRARDRLAVRLGVENRSDMSDGEVLMETVQATFHRVQVLYRDTLDRLRKESA